MDDNLIEKNYGLKILEKTLLQEKGARIVYRILTDKGKFIVKILPKSNFIEKFQSYIYAFEYIYQFFPNIPQIISTVSNKPYIENEDSYIYIIEFIEGNKPDKNNSEYFVEMGELMAEFHSIPYEDYKYTSDFTPKKELPNLISALTQNLKDSDERIKLVMENLNKIKNLQAGRLSIIHTDIFEGNIIKSSDGKYYLVDLDDAGIAESLIDIGYFIAHNVIQFEDNVIKFNDDNLRLFLKSYNSVRPLLKNELDQLVNYIYFGILAYIYDCESKTIVQGNFLRLDFLKNNESKFRNIVYSKISSTHCL